MYFTDRLISLYQDIKDIINDLRHDSPKAMKHIFDMFYKPLCCYAVRYVVNMPVAEEIVSDVMFKIWQSRHQGYRPETFREYLYTATRNTAINHLRQQQKQRRLSDNWAEQLRSELIEETPLDAMIAEETRSKLNRLMDTLPDQCRKVFVMSRFDNMNYDEIATQMGISTNTVKHHIKTALQKLRAGMGNFLLWLILFLSPYALFFIKAPVLFLFSIVFIIVSRIPYT